MRWLLAAALAAVLSGCVVRYLRGPTLTGTCTGACDHYVGCRGGDDELRAACLAECPAVFTDAETLMAFESLSCPDTVEYVEGPSRRPLGAPASTSEARAD